jgi:glycerol kinase
MTTILALDQSTSATKALIYTAQGELVDKVSVEHQQYYPQPGWVEHDAEEIYQNTLHVLKTVLEKNPQVKNEVLCLSITNQRETIVVFDKASGISLHPAIVWQCRRGDELCQQLIGEGHSKAVQQATGLKIDTYFPASKLKWLFDNHPEVKQQVLNGEALIGTIDTYLVYRLTNGECFATDHTNASRTLLYNIGQLAWDESMCNLFDVPIQSLPEVRESSATYGETNLDGYLDKLIPICGIMGDSQAALFAERCFRPGMAKATFGTGSSVLLNVGDQMKLSDKGIVTTIGWVYEGQVTYAFEGIINFTGATVTWLKDQLQLISDPAETEALAESVESNGGVYLVPAFVGLSAPYWRPDTKAAIVGLTPGSTRSHVVRAALESIAYQLKDVLDLMANEAGITLQFVHGDGGMVNNRFLMQFVADITGYMVRASALHELSALGAVMAGLLGMKAVEDLSALEELPHNFVDYQPRMDDAQVAELYTAWQAAVQRVL